MRQFNFFRGMVGPRVVAIGGAFLNEPYIPLQITEPPEGMSYRHWNILPEDIKRMSSVEMNAYIEGWETRNTGHVFNPYPDDFRLGNIWTRGWTRRQNRV